MNFQFTRMNASYSAELKQTWHYGGEYAIYDYTNDDCIDDPENWDNVFAVLDVDAGGELVGEFTIYLEGEDLWLGCGMKPILTGKGLGEAFIRTGLTFGIQHFNYTGEFVHLAVMKANQRARIVYERVGFRIYDEYTTEIEGISHEFWKLRALNGWRGP